MTMTIEERLAKARAARAESDSAQEKNPVKKWHDGDKKSKTLAIKAMCAACMGCEYGRAEPGWRKLVAECSAPHCPLHAVRPYK